MADPGLLSEVQAEVRTVLKGKDQPNYEDLVAMKMLHYSLATVSGSGATCFDLLRQND
jgi:4-diphosphocytidyl-2C-methyl-D-erythritol kinase